MKVFDVTFRNDVLRGVAPLPVFAEDAAQATRIAVRAVNNKRQESYGKTNYAAKFTPGTGGSVFDDSLTAEDVVKVEVVRDQVAS